MAEVSTVLNNKKCELGNQEKQIYSLVTGHHNQSGNGLMSCSLTAGLLRSDCIQCNAPLVQPFLLDPREGES